MVAATAKLSSHQHIPSEKVISLLTMGVKKIHACPNHCILFRGDTFKSLDKYPGVEPVGTRTTTFMTGMKPPQETRGRRVDKRWYKILNPQRTLH
jgi:hypothetical protein